MWTFLQCAIRNGVSICVLQEVGWSGEAQMFAVIQVREDRQRSFRFPIIRSGFGSEVLRLSLLPCPSVGPYCALNFAASVTFLLQGFCNLMFQDVL